LDQREHFIEIRQNRFFVSAMRCYIFSTHSFRFYNKCWGETNRYSKKAKKQKKQKKQKKKSISEKNLIKC
jgi:hypothetical protein